MYLELKKSEFQVVILVILTTCILRFLQCFCYFPSFSYIFCTCIDHFIFCHKKVSLLTYNYDYSDFLLFVKDKCNLIQNLLEPGSNKSC